MGWKDAPEIQSTGGEWQSAPLVGESNETQSSSVLNVLKDAGRGLATGAADVYRGIASVPNMFLDIPANVHNLVMPNSPPWRTATQMQNQALEADKSLVGITPENDPSKTRFGQVMGAVNRGVGGALAGIGAGSALAGSASPTASAVGEALAAKPGLQLTSAATGAASSDVARQAGAPAWGQWLAGLAGGAVPIGISAARQAMAPNPNLMNADQFKAASSDAFKRAAANGADIKPEQLTELADSLQDAAHSSGMRSYNDGRSLLGTVDAIKTMAEKGDPVPFSELQLIRQELKTNAGNPNGSVRRATMEMANKLDEFVSNLGDKDLAVARDFWRRGSNAEMVGNLVQKAADSANGYTASGFENAVRAQFRNFVKNDSKMRMLKPEEQAAMRQVANGTIPGNAMRALGRFAPRGPVSFMADLLAGGGGLGGVGVATLGEAGRQGATAATNLNVQRAQEAMLQNWSNPIPRPPISTPFLSSLLGLAATEDQR